MPAGRFQLAVQHSHKTFGICALVVGKKGIRFKEAACSGSHSRGGNNHYVSICTMNRFAGFLSRRMDPPVLDMTA